MYIIIYVADTASERVNALRNSKTAKSQILSEINWAWKRSLYHSWHIAFGVFALFTCDRVAIYVFFCFIYHRAG